MAVKNFEQEAHRIEDESSTMSEDNGAEAYSTDNNAKTDNLEDREVTVPISELRKVRSEAAKYRKELQSLKAKMEEEKKNLELSKIEETEKLRSMAVKAEAEANALRNHVGRITKESAIINAASALGFYNPKDAISLIEMDQIEVDDKGNIDEEKVFEIVKSLGESKPYLRKELSKAFYGPTNPAPRQGNWPKPRLTNANQIEQFKQQSRELTRQGRIVEATKLFNMAWEMEHGLKSKSEG
ncbi:TPA: hypothetical protein ENX78_04985 [Candidatus Poribacteria bacterium]|nr:hypothetical protein [Candidatus Poribacteria bacterium]